MFIFITPISNVIIFLVNNSFVQTNSINEILYPTRGWPKKDRNQLNVWQFLYQDVINKVGKANDNIVNGFNHFYLAEFDKYVKRNNKGEYMLNKPPIANTVKPLLILDSDMKKMFNQLYEEILNNNLQGK